MSEKYKDKSDNELVLMYKKSHNDDVEFEIISRYQKYSKKYAKELFDKFSFLYQVEFDDLYCILLGALFNAIRSYEGNSSGFYSYWKTAATHEVTTYIRKFPYIHQSNVVEYVNYEQGLNQSGYFKDRPEEFDDEYMAKFDLEEILTNPKNGFSEIDIAIFHLYTGGYSVNEIAKATNKTYHQIRYRVEVIREKIANILFNQ